MSGERWAFLRRCEIPCSDDRVYLTRWRIVQTPWMALYLHRFTAPDPSWDLHDHPWRFVSVVVRGGYVEERLSLFRGSTYRRRVRWWNGMRTHDAHAVVELLRYPTWTLVLTGARRRQWGFLDVESDSVRTWTAHDAR